jgi:hypothetical protein
MILVDTLAIILYIPIVIFFNLKIGTLNLTRLMLLITLVAMLTEIIACQIEMMQGLKESITYTCFAIQKAFSLFVVFCLYPLGLKMLEIP